MSIHQLKRLLAIFFIALAVPTATMVYQAYGQLKWEAFHQQQLLARELSLRIDARFKALIRSEQGRPFTDYSFFSALGSDASSFSQRSPLSAFPTESEIPGLLGYFQVDSAGELQTPLVPQANESIASINKEELGRRQNQQTEINEILSRNRLVKKKLPVAAQSLPASEPAVEGSLAPALSEFAAELERPQEKLSPQTLEEDVGVSAFDSLGIRRSEIDDDSGTNLSAGRVDDLELADRYDVVEQLRQQKSTDESKKRERKLSAEKKDLYGDTLSMLSDGQVARIRAFDNRMEQLEFSLLGSGHFVLFRRIWHEGERYVQGLLFEQGQFIDDLIAGPFYESSLADTSDLILSHQGDVVRLIHSSSSQDYGGVRLKGSELLYQTRLIAPFSDLELIFGLSSLPLAAGNKIVIWSAATLTLVLLAGIFMLFRLGVKQIQLAQQQQDFVSAVSHELKTPLTSIRMYGEMLREGWADESRRKFYYDFIFFESERLSRLINNVLQLARMTRRDDKPQLSQIGVGRLLEELTPRLESQLLQAGFRLQIDCSEDCRQVQLDIDSDWFTQIMINLVDNAVKFSVDAENKTVHLGCREQKGKMIFSIRDFGPGIPPDQIRKIFKLFYRSENELTRETVGTGIGLALVQRLVSAMGGEIDVLNREPGAEFQVGFGKVDQA